MFFLICQMWKKKNITMFFWEWHFSPHTFTKNNKTYMTFVFYICFLCAFIDPFSVHAVYRVSVLFLNTYKGQVVLLGIMVREVLFFSSSQKRYCRKRKYFYFRLHRFRLRIVCVHTELEARTGQSEKQVL